MKSWGRAILLGIFMWLIPFVIAFLSFPLRQASRPLFESIMAVAVTGTASVLGLVFLAPCERDVARRGLLVGLLWFAISVAIDAPLMLLGGPMKMSFAAYAADIGFTYVCIPIVTAALGLAISRNACNAADAIPLGNRRRHDPGQ